MSDPMPQGPSVGPAIDRPIKEGTDPMGIPVRGEDAERALDETSCFITGAAGDPADMGAHIDEQLIGDSLDFYNIVSLLGSGAMGRVYRAWNQRLHRVCAVKVIDPDLVRAEPERLEMFQREARSAAQLVHPHVVTIHLLGSAKGFHFIEMEYINGSSLAHHVKEVGKLDPLSATRFMRQICSGLASAHMVGLIHCDVKPDNVMLTGDKQAKIGDFGLARVFGGASMKNRKTVGTPYYMAPELFAGKEASVATDVYALGVTFYYLLTGRVPIAAKTMGELQKKLLFDEAPCVSKYAPDVPKPILDLVAGLMARDPYDRPSLSLELLSELDNLATQLVAVEELVAEAMDETDVVWQKITENRFTFLVPLGEGRRQTIIGEVVESAATDQPVMSFWTPCAPAKPDHYAFVLELNSKLPFGAVSIRRHEGQDHFVMTSNYPRATLDPHEIETAVVEMAKWADFVEHKLTGQDRF
jgi:serine/threonine protein kinase